MASSACAEPRTGCAADELTIADACLLVAIGPSLPTRVLAMPAGPEAHRPQPVAFELFDGTDGPGPVALCRRRLSEPSTKIMMAFEDPWWKDQSAALSGESITRLADAGVLLLRHGRKPTSTDCLFELQRHGHGSFWKALREDGVVRAAGYGLVSEGDLARSGACRGPTVSWSKKLYRQPGAARARITVPDPYAHSVHGWSRDPFGGGDHVWSANIPVAEHDALHAPAPPARRSTSAAKPDPTSRLGRGRWRCTAERMPQELSAWRGQLAGHRLLPGLVSGARPATWSSSNLRTAGVRCLFVGVPGTNEDT